MCYTPRMTTKNKITLAVIAAIIVASAAAVAYAGTVSTLRDESLRFAGSDTGGEVLSAAALNTAQWTGWISADGVDTIVFDVDYTNSAASAVTMRCETSRSNATANDAGYDLHSLAISSGSATSTTLTWSNAVAGDEKWTWQVANVPGRFLNCLFQATGADASDVADVYARGVTP